MRIMLKAAMISVAIALSGCMTQQGAQQSEFGQAMMGGLAQGLLSGAGASLGHGIATGSKRHLAAAAAQAAVGTAATAAAASSRSKAPSPRAAPAPRYASSSSGSHEGFPNTPQCRALMQLAQKRSNAALINAEAAFTRVVQMEHNCLASDPKHPLSRSKACGGGRYYHNFNDKLYCGWREAVAAYRHWAATNIRGMPADRYLQTYGLMSLFR